MELGLGRPRAESHPYFHPTPPQLPPTCSCLPEHSTKNTGPPCSGQKPGRTLSPMGGWERGDTGCSENPLGPVAIINKGSPLYVPRIEHWISVVGVRNLASEQDLGRGQAELKVQVSHSELQLLPLDLTCLHCLSRRLWLAAESGQEYQMG